MFQLTKTIAGTAKTFDLGYNGTVKLGGADHGKWKVNGANEVVLDGGTHDKETFAVVWKFEDNTLSLCNAAGARLFNISTDVQATAAYVLTGANLIEVYPDKNGSFSFTITPSGFALTAANDLKIKIGGTESEIKGRMVDSKGEFIYNFIGDYTPHFWALAGQWDNTTDVNSDGKLDMVFRYTIGAGGAPLAVALPESFQIDEKNRITVQFAKYGKITTIELDAVVKVAGGFLEVKLSKKLSPEERTLTFKVRGQITPRNFGTGITFEFELAKSDGTAGQSLSLKGKVSARLVNGSKVDIHFDYQTANKSQRMTVALGFRWESQHGDYAQFSYKVVGQKQIVEFKVGTEMRLRNRNATKVEIDAGLYVEKDGGNKAIRGFLSVTW